MSKKNKKEKSTLKRIPIHFIVLPLLLVAFLAVLIASPIYRYSKAKPLKVLAPYLAGIAEHDILANNGMDSDDHEHDSTGYTDEQKEKIKHFESIEYVEAETLDTNARVGSETDTIKTYRTTENQTINMHIAAVAKVYTAATTNDDETINEGKLETYIGFRSLKPEGTISVQDVQVYAADGFSRKVMKLNATITGSSLCFTADYFNNDYMNFITTTRNITLSKDVSGSYFLGLKKVKHPSLYIYIKYTDSNYHENDGIREYLVGFDYDKYFITGQTKAK